MFQLKSIQSKKAQTQQVHKSVSDNSCYDYPSKCKFFIFNENDSISDHRIYDQISFLSFPFTAPDKTGNGGFALE